MKVNAEGEGESAPLDVYLILDLSQSMVYDTPRPTTGRLVSLSVTDGIATSIMTALPNIVIWKTCDPLDVRIKPAAKYFVDQFDPRYDRVGVVVYHQFGTKVIGLSNDFTAVKAAIDGLNAFDHQGAAASDCPNTNPAGCNKNTNIGDGIMVAHQQIGTRRTPGRNLVDGLIDGREGECLPELHAAARQAVLSEACQTLRLCNECSAAEDWALNNAKDTWNRHETVIYTIAYGSEFTENPSYKNLLIDIADWTDNGVLKWYHRKLLAGTWGSPAAGGAVGNRAADLWPADTVTVLEGELC